MVDVIQIIGVVFALFALSRAVLRFRRGEITFKEFIFWILVWAAVIVVAVLPETARFISSPLGIVARPLDAIVYLSIILLFYLVFRLYVRLENIERNTTQLVREIAISRVKKKQNQ